MCECVCVCVCVHSKHPMTGTIGIGNCCCYAHKNRVYLGNCCCHAHKNRVYLGNYCCYAHKNRVYLGSCEESAAQIPGGTHTKRSHLNLCSLMRKYCRDYCYYIHQDLCSAARQRAENNRLIHCKKISKAYLVELTVGHML